MKTVPIQTKIVVKLLHKKKKTKNKNTRVKRAFIVYAFVRSKLYGVIPLDASSNNFYGMPIRFYSLPKLFCQRKV